MKRKKLEAMGKKVDEGVQLAFQQLREKQAAEQTHQPETARPASLKIEH